MLNLFIMIDEKINKKCIKISMVSLSFKMMSDWGTSVRLSFLNAKECYAICMNQHELNEARID